ncbi:MAG: SAM-dependent methyltransferase, partial [Phycisphaeraceae bacterium]
MDDRGMDLWRWLLSPEGAALRERAAAADPAEVSDVARLRKQFAADQVRAAIALAEARRKAAAKFGTPAALAADPEGVEQASSSAVARHKAARFARIVSGGRVIDLCSGIGGDAMALAEAGMRPVAIDRDPLRAWMSRANAHCPAAAADAGRVNVAGHFFHIDPARRTEGGRVWRLADYQPGPDVLAKLSGAARGGAVKLSPGIDLGELEEAGLTGEVEFISEAGRLVQAVLWTGELAEVERRATRLPGTGESPAELAGEPGEPPIIGELAEHVYTVDPAAERAELLGELCERTGLEAVHPRLGLLSGG